MNKATKIVISIGSIAIIAAAGIGGILLATTNDDSTPKQTTASSSSTSSNATSSSATSSASPSLTYKDGTYIADTKYLEPNGGSNTIKATVTVMDGKITAVETKETYEDSESFMYIDSFDNNVRSHAVGTSLADAKFSRIGGASLTTEAFNTVLDTIRTQATA